MRLDDETLEECLDILFGKRDSKEGQVDKTVIIS